MDFLYLAWDISLQQLKFVSFKPQTNP